MSDALSALYKQKQLLKNMYPEPLREMMETQRKLKDIYTSPVLEMIRANQSIFKHLYDSPVAQSLLANHAAASILTANEHIASMVRFQAKIQNATAFTRTFEKIDTISHITGLFETAATLAALQFDFDQLNEGDEEERIVVIDESKRVQRIITDIYNEYPRIYTIEPSEFEEMIAELLRNDGYEVELTKKTRDNGFDILALRKIDHLGSPLKFLVECKRYANRNPVGVDIIRSFKEVLSTENANRGIIATTSYFTKDAIKKRTQMPYLLDYRDKDSIIEWVAQYYTEKLT